MNKLIEIGPLSREDMEIIRGWRNKCPETLRTPYFLTEEMQAAYYDQVICNRASTTRYWAFGQDTGLVGMGGIENIQWENRIGELSVLVNPEKRGKGFGKQIVHEILNQAFNFLNLENVFAECYYCGNISFWEKVIEKYNPENTLLRGRKYYKGKYFDSLYMTFNRKDFNGLSTT
jgi:GNAT superfamily N-acetyltransferase